MSHIQKNIWTKILYIKAKMVSVRLSVRRRFRVLMDAAEPARTVGFGKPDSARTVGFRERDSENGADSPVRYV